MTRLPLVLLFAGLGPAVLPTTAAAAELTIAGDGGVIDRREARQERRERRNARLARRRPDLETFQIEPARKGLVAGGGLVVGASTTRRGFAPSLGYRMELGGGVTDRLTLGVSGGLTGHQGIPKGAAGVIDLVATVYPLWGLHGRTGFGVSSHAPVRGLTRRPGVGGFVGVGYEFRPMKRLAVALAVDWDARIRPDGEIVNAFIAGVTLRSFVNIKKR